MISFGILPYLISLIIFVIAGNQKINYIYSASGEKLACDANGSSTYYRGGVMVYGADDKLLYMFTPEGTVSRTEGSAGNSYTYNYFKKDHIGSTRAVLSAVDDTLQSVQSTDYYPFGLAFSTNNLNKNKYLFSGKELQDGNLGGSMLGLYDFGARHYDPFVARWLTQDPMRQFLSSYLYCANNPVSFIDPTGMWSSFSMADTSRNDFMVGTDMWGRDKFDSFSGLYIPYQDRPGGASVEGYGNSDYGTFATWYTISSGHNYLRENQGLKETYTFWTTIRRDGQEFTWYSNPWDCYIRERDSEMSDHERTISNPIVRSIHRAQFRFLRGTVELTASSLQRLGTGLSTVGYVATATGPGAEAGMPLVTLGNALQYTGLEIEMALDLKDRNFSKFGYNGITNGVMLGFGYVGTHYAPGAPGAIFNVFLTLHGEVLGYGAQFLSDTKK